MLTELRHAASGAAPGCSDAHDLTLIRRIAAGDCQAFEVLYQQYARRLRAYLARVLGHTDQVEDVMHEVMLAVWRQAPDYRPTGRVSAWIFGIAHHKALKALAAAARQDPGRLPPPADVPDAVSLEEDLTRQQRQQAVATALAALRPEQRAVVELTYYHQHSYQEIATLLDCPVNTVKTRMLKARRHLAMHLSRAGLGPDER